MGAHARVPGARQPATTASPTRAVTPSESEDGGCHGTATADSSLHPKDHRFVGLREARAWLLVAGAAGPARASRAAGKSAAAPGPCCLPSHATAPGAPGPAAAHRCSVHGTATVAASGAACDTPPPPPSGSVT